MHKLASQFATQYNDNSVVMNLSQLGGKLCMLASYSDAKISDIRFTKNPITIEQLSLISLDTDIEDLYTKNFLFVTYIERKVEVYWSKTDETYSIAFPNLSLEIPEDYKRIEDDVFLFCTNLMLGNIVSMKFGTLEK